MEHRVEPEFGGKFLESCRFGLMAAVVVKLAMNNKQILGIHLMDDSFPGGSGRRSSVEGIACLGIGTKC